MSPDYEYWFRLEPHSAFSHTLLGVFAFCVPVSVAMWLVYRGLLRPWLLRLLPAAMRAHLEQQPDRLDLATLFRGAIATAVGAFSHLLWDGFTHRDGVAVAAIPTLRAHALSGHGSMRWYQLSQHGSTALGLILLLLWARRAWKDLPPGARRFAPDEGRPIVRACLIVLATSAVGALLNGARVWGARVTPLLAFAAVGAMDAAAVTLVVLALLGRWARPRTCVRRGE